MIVIISTRFGQIRMHGGSAVALLKLMGHSGTVPGAILAADLPAALRQLRAGLETQGSRPVPETPPPPAAGDDREREEREEREPPVPLRNRALPLVAMIETAIERGSDLMWQ